MTVFLSTSRAKGGYCVKRPLMDLSRSEVTFVTTLARLPISVDSTNLLCYSSRAQIRYLLFPLLYQLGFHAFEEICDSYFDFFELAETRTRNKSVKSRILYH